MNPALLLLTHLAGTVVGAVLTLAWLVRRHRRVRAAQVVALLERMAANPIQPGADEVTFNSRTVCGHLIYGDTLGDLLVNEVYHERVCPFAQRNAA